MREKLTDSLMDVTDIVYICAYRINTNGNVPFVQYVLSKELDNRRFSLPWLPFNIDLADDARHYVASLLFLEAEAIHVDGFYEYNDKSYLFVDISKCTDDMWMADTYVMALADELVNVQKIYDTPVDEEVIHLFSQNDMLYLYDDKNVPYEIPVVAFVGKSTEQKLKFVHMFGESLKDSMACLGPYFYFTSFECAIQCEDLSLLKAVPGNECVGVVRFAIFGGTTKIIENNPNDPEDMSLTKQLRRNSEKGLDRITDYDGTWADQYDSIYLGNVQLDDHTCLNVIPRLVIKTYHQQIPLSYQMKTKTKEYGINKKIEQK